MRTEIITIGDELLIGQVIDTNSAFIGKSLNKIGIEVEQITSIRDRAKDIVEALDNAKRRGISLVITTGGLGPTKDDITKKTLAAYFQDTLTEHPGVLEHIKALTNSAQRPLLESIRLQAQVPSKAQALCNRYGTAPGLWFEEAKDFLVVSIPGVPTEMEYLIREEIIPKLKDRSSTAIVHKTIMVYGLPESVLAERIKAWEEALPDFLKLAYLPGYGKIRLRLTGRGTNEADLRKAIDLQIEALLPIIGEHVKGIDEDSDIETIIAKLLISGRQTLGVSESCTGGSISKRITAIAGASAYFKGGIVCYTADIKKGLLSVSDEILSTHGAVSAEAAERMATQARALLGVDYAIATTGNAGPTKDQGSDAPVGTVYISIASGEGVSTKVFRFGSQRVQNIERATNKSLEMLLEILEKQRPR